MKWDKLKELIQEDVVINPNSEGALKLRREAAERLTNVQGYLRRYDIRAVPALRDLFPHVFPKYLRTCMLYLNKDEKDNWTIDAKAK